MEECGVATSRVLNVGLGRGTQVTGGMSKAWPNLLSFRHHALLSLGSAGSFAHPASPRLPPSSEMSAQF